MNRDASADQLAADGVDIMRVAEKFAPEVVYLYLQELVARLESADQLAADVRAEAERTFNVSACERLAASNREYQDSHSYYLPTLALLLNETRRERDALVARLEAAERERDEVVRLAQGYEAAQRMEQERAEAAEAKLAEANQRIWRGGL